MSDYLNRVEFLSGMRNENRNRAQAFKRDERMESLAALLESDPELFDRMGTVTRISLGYYENAKRNAAATEGDN